MQQNPPVHQSHFDSIFNFVCPSGMERNSSKKGCIVYDLFFEVTTDHIKVEMEMTDKHEEEISETIFINHDKFRTWVEKSGYLKVSTGSIHQSGGQIVDDENDFEIGYAEFCEDHLTDAIIAQYLTSQKITNHVFEL